MEHNELTHQQSEYCDEIYNEYAPKIRQYCMSMISGKSYEVDDIVSETFCEFCKAIASGTEIKYPYAWLSKVAQRTVYKRYDEIAKAMKMEISLEAVESMVSYEVHYELKRLPESAIEKIYDEIMEELKPQERELIYLRREKKQMYWEIAKEKGKKPTAVKMQFSRIKKRVTELVKEKIEKY